MDASTQLAITSVATAVSTVIVAYIAFRQASLAKAVDEVKKQTDGINSALVAKASHAEGKEEGRIAEKADQAVAALLPPRPDA